MAAETVPLEPGVLWAPVIYIKAPSVGGIETGRAERLAPEATEAEAMAAAVRAMKSRPEAISASALRLAPELDHAPCAVEVVDPTPSAPPRLTGRWVVPGGRLQCPPRIEAVDEVDVDFDIDLVTDDGLYALDLITAGRVAWMGCRAFRRRVDGVVEVDEDGLSTWRSINAGGGLRDMRIAGRVLSVRRGGRLHPAGVADAVGFCATVGTVAS